METLRRPGTINESFRSCACLTCLGSINAGLLAVASSGTNVHFGLQDDETLSRPSQLVLEGPKRTSLVESDLAAAAVDQRPIPTSIESFESTGAQSSSSHTFLKRSFKLWVVILNVVPPLLDPPSLLSDE